MSIGLAQSAILGRVERLRQQNPALLGLIEQAYGVSFPETRQQSVRRVKLVKSISSPNLPSNTAAPSPRVEGRVGFPEWYSHNGFHVSSKPEVALPKSSRPWQRTFNMSLVPTLVFLSAKRKKKIIGFGGGELPISPVITPEVTPEQVYETGVYEEGVYE